MYLSQSNSVSCSCLVMEVVQSVFITLFHCSSTGRLFELIEMIIALGLLTRIFTSMFVVLFYFIYFFAFLDLKVPSSRPSNKNNDFLFTEKYAIPLCSGH
jgi:hypothetical protein